MNTFRNARWGLEYWLSERWYHLKQGYRACIRWVKSPYMNFRHQLDTRILMLACEGQYNALEKVLTHPWYRLWYRPNISHRDLGDRYDFTAVSYALWNDHLDCALLLEKHGWVLNYKGHTATGFQLCAEHGHLHLVRWFVEERGVDLAQEGPGAFTFALTGNKSCNSTGSLYNNKTHGQVHRLVADYLLSKGVNPWVASYTILEQWAHFPTEVNSAYLLSLGDKINWQARGYYNGHNVIDILEQDLRVEQENAAENPAFQENVRLVEGWIAWACKALDAQSSRAFARYVAAEKRIMQR